MSQNTQMQIQERKRKRSKRKNIMLVTVIAALIISTSCTLYMNIDNPHLHNLFLGFGLDVVSEDNIIEFDKTEKYAIADFDGNAVVVRNSQITSVNSDMASQWTVERNNTFPVVKTNGKYLLNYSFDAENAAVIKNGNVTELVTGNNVIGGSINENGYSAVITREKGYRAQVIVFSPEGEVMYKWHSADNHITDAVVSPDNKTLVTATVDFSTNSASGGLMFFNFSQDKPYAGQILENNIIMQLQFTGKNSLLVLGDTGVALYDILGAKKEEYSYDSKKLTNFDISESGNVVVALSESDSAITETDVKILSKNLKEKGVYKASGAVTCVNALDSDIILVCDRTLSVISNRGNEIKKLDVNKDVKRAVLFENGKEALIASGSIAEIVRLN